MRAKTAKRKRQRLIARLCVVTISVAILCGLIWFGLSKALDKFFFSNPAYNLCQLLLETDGVMGEEDLVAETGIKTGDNIFRIDLARIDRKLREIPMVADVYIERTMPDRLEIRLTRRIPVAWISSSTDSTADYDPSSMTLVDDSGFLMKPRLLLQEYHQLPVIYGVNVGKIQEGALLEQDDLKNALHLLREARGQPQSLLVIRSLNISKGYCIDAVTDQNAHLKFASGDFLTQLEKLQRLLAHCRDTGRALESVNLMVAKNTPVTFVMTSPPPPVPEQQKPTPQKSKPRKN
ncbi:MAG: FtsQ-type POTRA domain-containing protein [bacterium]